MMIRNEMGSLENRTEKMQTPIPTTPRSPMINLSSDKNIVQELTDTVSLSTPTTSKAPHKQRRISRKYSHLPGVGVDTERIHGIGYGVFRVFLEKGVRDHVCKSSESSPTISLIRR
ncbi:hypothetical protein Tco_0366491 [Tanacetum coccineum]